MKKSILFPIVVSACILLSACSQNQLQNQLTTLQSTLTGTPVTAKTPQTAADTNWGEVHYTFTVKTDVDTAALRLKRYYKFTTDSEIAAAHNSGQGNAGWMASAMGEGTDWAAQPGAWYRMRRNWAANDILTIEVSHEGTTSQITATYRSANPDHLAEKWTAHLRQQIPEVATGALQ